MTDDRLPLAELLAKAGDGDVLRSVAEAVLQMVMEADVEGLIGAGRYERTGERLNWRNGFRDRTLDTRLGALHLRIPKLRQGSSSPVKNPGRRGTPWLFGICKDLHLQGLCPRRAKPLQIRSPVDACRAA
jgi:transposase-like protein